MNIKLYMQNFFIASASSGFLRSGNGPMYLQHDLGIFTIKFFMMDLFCFKFAFSKTSKTVLCEMILVRFISFRINKVKNIFSLIYQ